MTFFFLCNRKFYSGSFPVDRFFWLSRDFVLRLFKVRAVFEIVTSKRIFHWVLLIYLQIWHQRVQRAESGEYACQKKKGENFFFIWVVPSWIQKITCKITLTPITPKQKYLEGNDADDYIALDHPFFLKTKTFEK